MKYRTIGQNPETRRKVSVLSLGAMMFGTTIDESTSYAILDRYVEAGGTFIDTSDNYAFWASGTQGGESETLLGRWRRSRGIGDEVIIATKLGARPTTAGATFTLGTPPDAFEGLSAKVIRESSERSRERLGVERLDLLYAHIDDPLTPPGETVEAFAELVVEGSVGLLGVSNHWSWQVERARNHAVTHGLPGYEVLQYCHTYLRQRTDLPGWRSTDGESGTVSGDLISYLRAEPQLTLVAYSPLLSGRYVRTDRPLGPTFEHAGTPARLAALHEVAGRTGATVNQVVLSWLIGGEVPVIPLMSASSLAQLEENLGGADLELTPQQRQHLDSAR